MRERLANALGLSGLLLLGVLYFGWAFYPPLALPMALANLIFILAWIAAWLIRRLAGNR